MEKLPWKSPLPGPNTIIRYYNKIIIGFQAPALLSRISILFSQQRTNSVKEQVVTLQKAHRKQGHLVKFELVKWSIVSYTGRFRLNFTLPSSGDNSDLDILDIISHETLTRTLPHVFTVALEKDKIFRQDQLK